MGGKRWEEAGKEGKGKGKGREKGKERKGGGACSKVLGGIDAPARLHSYAL